MENSQIEITFDNNTLKPILTFIEETKNGYFTNGYREIQEQRIDIDTDIYQLESDCQCLIYGISY